MNYLTPKLGMSPLHWAAHKGDSEMVQLLLDHNANQTSTTLGNTAVDIAGFCGNIDVVLTFCKDLEQRIVSNNSND